jgi:hypothetical protein
MDPYFSMGIQTSIHQVLETIFILRTTKNFETLKSRYAFLLERMKDLEQANLNSQYASDVRSAIENYQSIYPARSLEEKETVAVLQPNNFDVDKFYVEALDNCIKRYAEEQIGEIGNLKSENARAKRRLKIIEKLNGVKEDFRNSSLLLKYDHMVLYIENLINKISSTV